MTEKNPFTGAFYAEPLAQKGSDEITVVAESFLQKIMCAPNTATQEEVERAAGPSGTSRGWRVDEDRADKCVPCKDDPTRTHWLLLC